MNFNVTLGLGEKVAILWGTGHSQVFLGTFKTDYFLGSVKIRISILCVWMGGEGGCWGGGGGGEEVL